VFYLTLTHFHIPIPANTLDLKQPSHVHVQPNAKRPRLPNNGYVGKNGSLNSSI
jgi:hypothetical protein